MAMEEFKELLSFTASISTIIQFMTGIVVCLSIKRKGSAGDISGFPFLAGVLGCSLWLRYSMMLEDPAMELVNTVGLMFQLSYTIFYYFYVTPKGPFQKQLTIVISIICATILYVAIESDLDIAKFRLGLTCCATTLIFCAAPLASLGDVLKNRSTESLPFYLILANVAVSGQWYLYGVAINNSFVQIPNFIGCLIASFQLALFAFFPSTSRMKQIPDMSP